MSQACIWIVNGKLKLFHIKQVAKQHWLYHPFIHPFIFSPYPCRLSQQTLFNGISILLSTWWHRNDWTTGGAGAGTSNFLPKYGPHPTKGPYASTNNGGGGMTPCRRAGRVSNIQDCQSDSQLSTLELLCLILGKLHDHSYNTPKQASSQMPASWRNFFFSEKLLQLSTFSKGQISALKYVE